MTGGHSSREHRRFSPSQAERFFVCKGSTNFLATVPARPNSPYAVEGTTGHEVLEAGLANRCRTAIEAHEASMHFAVELDKDYGGPYENFYMSINVALRYVWGIIEDNPGAIMWLESRVSPPVNNAPGEADGFCDIVIWCPVSGVLYVIDYKHGAGITKSVIENKQLKQYGAGVVCAPEPVVPFADIENVTLVIVQPRAFHPDGMIREWDVTPWSLYEYLDELDEVIAENLDPRAPLVPDDGGKTTDHCRFCDGNTLCPAREAKALAPLSTVSSKLIAIEDVRASLLPAPASLDIQKLARIRAHSALLKRWLKDVDNHVEELLRNGHAVPGAKLVEVMPRRKPYGDEHTFAAKAAALAGVPVEDLYTPPQLIGMPAIEALVVEAFKAKAPKGGKNKASEQAKRSFAFLTIKESSGNKTVVDETDPRPAVNRVSGLQQIAGAVRAPSPNT